MPVRYRFAAAVLLSAAAAPALAQNTTAPVLTPTRDVAVTYRVQGEERSLRMSWLTAEQRMRVDLPDAGQAYLILDRRANQGMMVMPEEEMVMSMPMNRPGTSTPMLEPGPNARFTREGTDRVAGHACTVWRYQDGADSGRSCVTADGVMLRGEGRSGGHEGRIEAVEVTYGSQDASRFRAPPGYQTMQLPAGIPGMGAPGTNSALPPPSRGR
jgi:hypothetical protein